jgi:hypothetical protein
MLTKAKHVQWIDGNSAWVSDKGIVNYRRQHNKGISRPISTAVTFNLPVSFNYQFRRQFGNIREKKGKPGFKVPFDNPGISLDRGRLRGRS